MKIPHHLIKSGFLAVCSVALALELGLTPAVRAANATWDGGGGSPGNWNTATNWVGDTVPAVGDTLVFTGTTQTNTVNDFAAGRSYLGITFNNTSTGGSFNLTGNSITISNGGGAVNIQTTGTTGTPTQTLGLNIFFNQGTRDSVFTAVANNSLNVTGNISSASTGTVIAGGGGSVVFSGNNSYTGATRAQWGTLDVNSIGNAGQSSAIGAGSSIQLGGLNGQTGYLVYTGATASTDRRVQVGVSGIGAVTSGAIYNNNAGATLTFTAANFTLADTGALAGTRTLALGGLGLGVIQGVISDNNATGLITVRKETANTWALSGNNTYTGATQVTLGTLLINGNQSAATGAVSVSSSATLGGNGTIGGAITISNLGILSPGTLTDTTTTLTLNAKDLTMGGVDSKLNINITATGDGNFGKIAGINLLTANGDITFTLSGTYTTASWDVLDFSSKTGNFDSITLAGSYVGTLTRSGEVWSGISGGQNWTFDQTSGILSVVPEPATWGLLAAGMTFTMMLRRRRRG